MYECCQLQQEDCVSISKEELVMLGHLKFQF
jgi:hypothetical protein